MDQVKKLWSQVVSPGKGAILCAVLGYLIAASSLKTSNINGVRTCSYSDVSALFFGGLGFVIAAVALNAARSSRNKNLNYGVAVVGLLLGLLNVARGLGYIDSPCP